MHISGTTLHPRDRARRPSMIRRNSLSEWAQNSKVFCRYMVSVLGAVGMAFIYGMKVNMSVAIVAMVNHTVAGHHDNHHENQTKGLQCFDPDLKHSQNEQDGPFMWTDPQQGLVLGSYFWGYLITQVPGGYLADLAGGKWVFFAAAMLNMLGCLLSPLASGLGYQYLIAMRVLQGLGGGVTFPAMNVIISKWAPLDERSTISAIIYGGTSLGTVASLLSSGILAEMLGWQFIFYVHGGLCLLWCLLWASLASDTPSSHPFISEQEREFIETHSKHEQVPHHKPMQSKHSKFIPWRKILLSVPVWAIIISHTLNNFGWYMLLVELPLFMRTGLGFEIKENAGLSALPFLCNWLFSLTFGHLLDWMHMKRHLPTTWVRKISVGVASVIPALCLIGVTQAGCDKYEVVLLMVIATLFYGAMFSGVFSNHVDIADNYAGVLMGISNMVATIPGFAVPAFVGALTHSQPGLEPWHTVFYVTAGLLLLEFVVFSLMATGEEQEWNKSYDHHSNSSSDSSIEKNGNNSNDNINGSTNGNSKSNTNIVATALCDAQL